MFNTFLTVFIGPTPNHASSVNLLYLSVICFHIFSLCIFCKSSLSMNKICQSCCTDLSMRLHGLVKLLNFFQALLNYLMLESVMLLARDAGHAPAQGKMAALTLKIFKTAPPEDSYPGPALPLPDKFFFCPAPLCPEAK